MLEVAAAAVAVAVRSIQFWKQLIIVDIGRLAVGVSGVRVAGLVGGLRRLRHQSPLAFQRCPLVASCR